MAINPKQLEQFIEQTLKETGFYSKPAVDLLMITAAQESHLGTYIKQLNGPALGIYQMEPATHDDIVNNYLKNRSRAWFVLWKRLVQNFNAQRLIYDLRYATIMARVFYLRFPEPIPNNPQGYIFNLAQYWKHYWNTISGKGRISDAIRNYEKYVLAV